jgi:hypothetical protein
LLNFGTINVGAVATLKLRIANHGLGQLIGSVETGGLLPPLMAASPGGPFKLAHNRGETIKVRAAPTGPGHFMGTIKIDSNDPKRPTAEVVVKGTAKKRSARKPH